MVLVVVVISIHAPAWGATATMGNPTDEIKISIHAPAWGATLSSMPAPRRSILFQFTPPRGGRPGGSCSIAPAVYFNSRPRVGGDQLRGQSCIQRVYFNSRPRVGGDGCQRPEPDRLADFNSRPRVGGDSYRSNNTSVTILFQFTPPRGGRQQIYIKVCVCICAKWEVKGWGSIFCRQVNRFSCNCRIIYCVPCKKCNHFSAPTHRKIMWEGGRRKAAYNNRGSPVCTGPVLPMVSTRFL